MQHVAKTDREADEQQARQRRANLRDGDEEVVPRQESARCHPAPCDLIARAGVPTTVVSSGTSAVTVAPAPTMARRPMRTPGIAVAPVPTNASSRHVTLPAKCTPGERLT